MKIRSMIAAAVRPWFEVQANERSIKVIVGNSRRNNTYWGFVVRDRRSNNSGPSLWLGSRWVQFGDLDIGFGRSDAWRRIPAVDEKSANDSKTAA